MNELGFGGLAVLGALCGQVLAACGGSSEGNAAQNDGNGGSMGGSPNVGGAQNDGGVGNIGATGNDGGTAGLGPDDRRERESFDTLQACDVAQACPWAHVETDECESVDREAALCILAALKDGVPGTYASRSLSCSASGNQTTQRFFLVHANRSVSTAEQWNFDGATGYGDAGLCSLQLASYFETCIELLESEESEAWHDDVIQCARGDHWVVNCRPEPVSCDP